ncbi:patatin-like phospholipase family protein [Pseudonocardia sp. RS11V-5]|uniref:patatin-like phospholipase family protein n=1 Tax=Pseudonocardia terrae TaxID=2905831 RepID=UPI001E61B6B7|nr:patatin-like phospholipase family protein [Pseudonocardia terrae]MCE3555737.1 patatin-like phospholipase family protein [Pseudonocardia terrae]
MAEREVAAGERIGVVLAGGGARGAYEAGALSVLLPALDAEGRRPALYVGTSAGAINAALFAAYAHRPVADQVAAVLQVWQGISLQDVLSSVVRSSFGRLLTFLGQTAHIPGVRLTSLVDTAPLYETARIKVNWTRLHTNTATGVTRVAVVATSVTTGRATVFVDGGAVPAPVQDRPIDYVGAAIGVEHVLASAAIPVLFPPGQIGDEWFLDGGVRLNVPLKPALDLGADRLVVLATHPATVPPVTTPLPYPACPDVDDSIIAVLDAALVEPMIEDLRNLGRVNRLVGSQGRSVGGRAYRQVPFAFIGPCTRGALARTALEAYAATSRGLRRRLQQIRRPDLPLMAWLLTGPVRVTSSELSTPRRP